ncbi:hypothetical protein NLI96_g7894 [Meripilus lineatus]|uniref:Phospholipase D/nuclease n=1 Tax=Meripilus lineatus TaxID=2056292 RepID=A0AAD5YEG5_9APHY|nr:hypothetical protein NLI96_g7894 [Physisporinus lineatus]
MQAAWVQDFPKLPEPIPHDSKATDFASTWTRILRGVNVVPALLTLQKNGNANLPISRIEDIRCRWDFSKVKVELIPSLAGKHEGWPKVIQTGHTALMKAVRDIGGKPRKGKELVLECQGSSIGSYTTQWLNEFYCSAKGDSAEEWLDQPRGRRAKLPFPTIRILFPSLKTVRESALGEPGGGTMFCRRNQWDAAKFPRDHFFDSKSRRGSVLMHTKVILATYRDTGFVMNGKTRAITPLSGSESDDSDIVEIKTDQHKGEKLAGWAYLGSHNFTPSAWGTLSGSSFNPSLNITNYELGIVLPLKTEEDVDAIACWERPAKKYVLGKDQPWKADHLFGSL